MCHHYESDYLTEREPAYEPETEADEEEDDDLEEVDPVVPPAND
ncbi:MULTISPECIES: hypothetical protein [Halostella]|nr:MULTISPECIES: hypothetical protein [Halostella]